MIRQVNGFDTTILKKGRGVVITEKAKSASPKVYHALILECRTLGLEVAYVDNSVVDVKTIKPNDVAEGNVKVQMMVPFKEPAPATGEVIQGDATGNAVQG